MGFLDFFKKNREPEPEPLLEATLSNLRTGWFLDYDLKTWQVDSRNHYDWGYGEITNEWQLKAADGDIIYLEKESDDEEEWSISRKMPLGRLGSDIIPQFAKKGAPPNRIEHEGITYNFDESSGGHFYPNGKGPGQKMISWDYEDDDGEHYLTIEQWGEDDYEASIGMEVEEYQFTNILPGSGGGI